MSVLAKPAGRASRVLRDCLTGPGNSFDGDTRVLLADGSSKPICEVRVGDQVLATDPDTGRTEGHTVTRLIVGSGEKDLVDVTVATPGGLATLTATDGHPFWDGADHVWVDAEDLTTADRLRTPTGTELPVTATHDYQRTDTVYNLTVETLHTYYVLAGGTPVLVHNATPGQKCDLTLGAGANAREGVALVDGNIDAPGVRSLVDEAGRAYGCHTCGARASGTPSGGWIPDHQHPTSLVAPGSPQTAYPHCIQCARTQGGIVSTLLRGVGKPF